MKNNSINYFGTFKTKQEAKEYEEILIENNWDKNNLNSFIFEEYINFDGEKYLIQKQIGNKVKNFGSYKILKHAIKKRDELIKNNWNIKNKSKPKKINKKQNVNENNFRFTNKKYSNSQKKAITNNLEKLFNSKLPTDEIYELEKYINYLTRSANFDIKKFNNKFNNKLEQSLLTNKNKKYSSSQKRAITLKKQQINKSKLPKKKKIELEKYLDYLTRSKSFDIKKFNDKFDKKFNQTLQT